MKASSNSPRHILLGMASLCLPAVGWALTPLGDGGQLDVSGTVNVRYDDNLYLSKSDQQSEVVTAVSPKIDVRWNRGQDVKLSASYRMDAMFYADQDSNNSVLSDFSASGSYLGAYTTITGDAGYSQSTDNNREVRNSASLTRRDNTSYRLSVERAFSPKTSLSVGVSGGFLSYGAVDSGTTLEAAIYDSSSLSIPVDVYYKIRPKLDLSAGVVYGSTDSDRSGAGFKTWTYNIGLRGQLSPKLRANIRAGLSQKNPDGGEGKSSISAGGGLDWELSPRSSVGLSLNRTFDLNAAGEGYLRTTVVLRGEIRPADRLSVTGALSYEHDEFDALAPAAARTDDFYQVSVTASYALTENWSVSAGALHRTNSSSDEEAFGYSNNTLNLSAVVRY